MKGKKLLSVNILLMILALSTSLMAQSYSGGSGNEEDPFQIATKADLQYLSDNDTHYDGYYFIQTADIYFEASDFQSGGDFYYSGSGFLPIGGGSGETRRQFKSSYDGNNKVIDGIYMNRSEDDAGFFGEITLLQQTVSPWAILHTPIIENVTLTNVNITNSGSLTGGLVGQFFKGTISNCSVSGSVTGTGVGGLVGQSEGLTTIEKSNNSATVSGINNVGGIIGYAGDNVSGCYSTGDVTGQGNVGGFVGVVGGDVAISNCYSTGDVNRTSGATSIAIGGFAGSVEYDYMMEMGGLVYNCYSLGSVNYINAANPTNKGFSGSTTGEFSSNYFDSDVSNQSSAAGATAKTTVQMKTQGTFTGWDFTTIWALNASVNDGYPYLQLNVPVSSASAPTLTTTAITTFDGTSATMGGNITDDDGADVTERGVVYSVTSTNANPEIGGTGVTKVQIGSGTGEFSDSITGLTEGTEYSVQAYAINSGGTSYGGVESFTTSAADNSVYIDYEIYLDDLYADVTNLHAFFDEKPTWSCSFNAAENVGTNNNFEAFYDDGEYGSGAWYNRAITLEWSGQTFDNYYCNLYMRGWRHASHPYPRESYNTGDLDYATGTYSPQFSSLPRNSSAIITREIGSAAGNNHFKFEFVITWDYSIPVNTEFAVSDEDNDGFIISKTNDNNYRVTEWEVEVRAGSTEGEVAYSNTEISGDSHEVTGLNSGTTYFVRFRAKNEAGTGEYSDFEEVTTIGSALATLTTTAITTFDATSATMGGNITDDGGENVTERGVVYSVTSTNANPEIGGTGVTKVQIGSGTGEFSESVTGLTAGTEYSVQAYAINSAGTSYGGVESFTTTKYSGGSGTANDPYQIDVLSDLQYLSEHSDDWDKHFIQTENIDASETSSWNSGAGFSPFGNETTKFTGSYDGDGYTIDNLYINRPSTYYIGLFGYTEGATISNLGVTNVDITGNTDVGGLVGINANSSTVSNSYSTGSVDGSGNIVGGLVGLNLSTNSIIENSFSTCNVSGTENVGGLVGRNNSAVVTNSYSTGDVSGTTSVGGLVGYNHNGGDITYSYSTGDVSGTTNVGGFIGVYVSGTLANNFWKTDGVGGLEDTGDDGNRTNITETSDANMKIQSTFTGWDFTVGTGDWNLGANGYISYPYIQAISYDDPGTIPEVNPIPGLEEQIYYRSVTNGGSWSSTDTWEISTDQTNWSAATEAPNAENSVGIVVNHDITIDIDVTIGQTTINENKTLTVDLGTTLTVADGDGTDLTVNGTLANNGTVSVSTGTVDVNPGGSFNSQGSFVFTDAGYLYLGGSISSFNSFTKSNSTVVYDSNDSQIIKALDYHTLVLAGGDKVFSAGTTSVDTQIEIDYGLTISGMGTAENVTVQVSTPYAWNGTSGNESATASRVFNINADGETVTIQNMTIKGGDISELLNPNNFGGCIYVNNGTLNLELCVIDGAKSAGGGGIYNEGTLTIEDCVISNNMSYSNNPGTSYGGGIYSTGILNVSNSTVSSNMVSVLGEAGGGGICGGGSGLTTITNSTVFGNIADDQGDSVVGGAYGGGISIFGDGGINITNSTISGNSVTSVSFYGSGFYLNSTAEISNTIIAQNEDNSTNYDFYYWNGSLTDNGYNVIEYSNVAANDANGFDSATSILYNTKYNQAGTSFTSWTQNGIAVSGELGLSEMLADNGGPTQTVALGENSFALAAIPYSAGSNTWNNSPVIDGKYYDQRGVEHVANSNICIGAYSEILAVSGLWVGNTSSDWNTASNWSDETVPTSTVNVTIPADCDNYPQIDETAQCQNITIENGGTVTINSDYSIRINGDFIMEEGGVLTNNGTLIFIGDDSHLSDNRTTKINLGHIQVGEE